MQHIKNDWAKNKFGSIVLLKMTSRLRLCGGKVEEKIENHEHQQKEGEYF